MLRKVLNDNEEQKQRLAFVVNKNAVIDKGDGLIMFSKPVVITDNSEQWNGTRYDIKSMVTDSYDGHLTADHNDSIQALVGKVLNVQKTNSKVTIDGVQFATKQNALAQTAYDLMVGGYLTDFSIETIGPWPDEEDRTYYNAQLVGLSVVVDGNNKSAKINHIIKNSMEKSRSAGLDTSAVEDLTKYPIDKTLETSNNDIMLVKVKNTKSFEISVKFKNAEDKEETVTLKAGESVNIPEAESEAVEKQIDNAAEPVKEDKTTEAITAAVVAAMKPVTEKIDSLEKQMFDKGAQEPKFTTAKTANINTGSELAKLGYKERHGIQIADAWEMLKGHGDGAKLREINEINLEALKAKEKVNNAITIADMGNFVISPELLSEIEGFRSNFTALLSKLDYRETLSLQMAWLSRNGDISMTEVEMCDDGADGNLKPISEYSAEINTSNLHELAAVTPVCNAATRFLAADLLTDVASGYRNDFDRKRAQLFIARLQQAVNTTGNKETYSTDTDVHALKSFFAVAAAMQQDIMGGYYILSQKSYWELMSREMGAGINTETGFRIFTSGENGPLMLGVPYIIVPNELMPTLNSAETRSFVVEGTTVTIDQAVFFVDLSTFSGRTSGGLMYDLSTEAAYEDGETVKSAFQRNELVLRGSFFRGGAIRNVDKVVGLGSRGVS